LDEKRKIRTDLVPPLALAQRRHDAAKATALSSEETAVHQADN
jgi:hypothetical protein